MKWEELTNTGKKNRLHDVLIAKDFVYWIICGREKQLEYYFKRKDKSTNLDDLRKAVYEDYAKNIYKHKNIYDKKGKISAVRDILLLSTEKEEIK